MISNPSVREKQRVFISGSDIEIMKQPGINPLSNEQYYNNLDDEMFFSGNNMKKGERAGIRVSSITEKN